MLWLVATVAESADSPLLPEVNFKHPRQDRPVYFIPKIDGNATITIDGKLDDPLWKDSLTIDKFVNEVGEQGRTTLRLMFDGERMYLGVRCEGGDLAKLRATAAAGSRDQHIWNDHCIDFKIEADGHEYQFLVNSAGAWSDSMDGDLAWNPKVEVKTAIVDGAWQVEMKFLNYGEMGQLRATEGRSMSMAFGRAGTGEGDPGGAPLQTLTKPYGDTGKAPIFVFGSADAYRARLDKQLVPRDLDMRFLMDREVYPRFAARGLGRIRLIPTGPTALTGKLALVVAVKQGEREIVMQRIEPIEDADLDLELDLAKVPLGEYTLEARLYDGAEVFKKTTRRLVIRDEPAAISGKIAITVPAAPADLPAQGLTFGVPFPWGALASSENVKLVNADGREVPMQAEVTGRWSRHGHIRWLLISAVVPASTRDQRFQVEYGPAVKRAAPPAPVSVKQDAQKITVETGSLHFEIPRSKSQGIANAGGVVRTDPTAGPYLIDEQGVIYYGALDEKPEVVIEADGPIKAQVSVTGWHVSATGAKLGKFVLRYTAYAGLPTVQMDHTFIVTADSDKVRYRDVGYALASDASRGFFGAPRITPFNVSGKDDSAYLIQFDDLRAKIVQSGKFVDEFGRAEGWVNAGGLTVSVRDFWQNFPKEFEARADRLIVHFWPAHGETPLRTGNHLSKRNAYQLWFAHEGQLLNFKTPKEYLDLMDPYNLEEAKVINAMGVSKTHQMMLHFGTDNWDQSRARSTALVFQSNPTAICDPRWVCDSKALGEIGARDAERRPELERAIDGTIQSIMRQNDEDRDYGMWNFGDSHHIWSFPGRSITLHRTWRATHHNWPRWPWLQYARSGNKDYFDYACRNARHVADISHCHYTDEEFAKLGYPRGKLVGGLCDYKGFAHWSAGDRIDYNSVADVMLHHYYFTGERPSRDIAEAHCNAMVKQGKVKTDREGSGQAVSLVEYYYHTWDNDVLDFLERQIDLYVQQQPESGIIGTPAEGLTYVWTPAFNRYTDLTGAQRGEQLTTRIADLVCRTGPDRRLQGDQDVRNTGASVLISLAYAYLHTGQEKYIRMAATRANLFSDAVYHGDDPRYQGLTALWKENRSWSWFLMDLPYYVGALNRYGKTPEPAPLPSEHVSDSLIRQEIEGKTWFTFQARISQASDKPFSIDVPLLENVEYVTELVPVDVPGKTIRVVTPALPPQKGRYTGLPLEGWKPFHLDVPVDGAREYAFRVRSSASYFGVSLPITTAKGMREVYPVCVDGNKFLSIGGGEWFYFDVPEGIETLRLALNGEEISEVQLRDSRGKLLKHEAWVAANGPLTIALPVAGERRGWSIRVRGDAGRGRATLRYDREGKSRPLYLSVSPDKFFWPSKDQATWPRR